MRRWYLIALLGSVALASEPRGDGSPRAWTTQDSWYRPPPDMAKARAGQAVPDADLMEVQASQDVAAERLLNDADAVDVTPERAAALVGHVVPALPGHNLYLVRGVALSQKTGKFSALQLGGDLVVDHQSLGRRAARPAKVYVTCAMDE